MKNWQIVLAVVAVLATCALLVCGGLVLLFVVGTQQSPLADAQLVAPGEIRKNETFEISVNVSNPHAEAVTLDSIDIDNALLQGFQVVSVTPEPISTDDVPFLDQRSWGFGTSLEPGEELTVTFTAKAVEVGRFTGSVDVCNPAQDFNSLFADVIVHEE